MPTAGGASSHGSAADVVTYTATTAAATTTTTICPDATANVGSYSAATTTSASLI